MERARRLRRSESIRNLFSEYSLVLDDFVMPCFLVEGTDKTLEIKSMPGIYRFSPNRLLKKCEAYLKSGIKAIAPFPSISDSKKNKKADEALNPEGLMPHAISLLKKEFPELVIFADVALDPYNSDGHDGLVENGKILNDATLPLLAEMSLVLAQAGADFVAPSDMMDGRVGYIRGFLDKNGYEETGILSYTAKYASAFYSPFREALDSEPKSGDKKTYQMNPANSDEAAREAKLDIQEGADVLMVKPGLAYLDIVRRFKVDFNKPVAVYNVSGEYAMFMNAVKNGLIDYETGLSEILIAFKRAGADLIFSYHSEDFANFVHSNAR